MTTKEGVLEGWERGSLTLNSFPMKTFSELVQPSSEWGLASDASHWALEMLGRTYCAPETPVLMVKVDSLTGIPMGFHRTADHAPPSESGAATMHPDVQQKILDFLQSRHISSPNSSLSSIKATPAQKRRVVRPASTSGILEDINLNSPPLSRRAVSDSIIDKTVIEMNNLDHRLPSTSTLSPEELRCAPTTSPSVSAHSVLYPPSKEESTCNSVQQETSRSRLSSTEDSIMSPPCAELTSLEEHCSHYMDDPAVCRILCLDEPLPSGGNSNLGYTSD